MVGRKKERIEWIDFGKGLTVLLVVIGHVILGLFESNQFPQDSHQLLFFTQIFYLFHIPVFFALSGYFFKPVENIVQYKDYLFQKIITLGIPYLFYSIIQFSLQTLGGSAVRDAAKLSDLLNIYQKPFGVSWYLYTLWWIYIVFGFISIKVKSQHTLLVISFVGFLLALFMPFDSYILQKLSLWSLFFILGYYLKQSQLDKHLKTYWLQYSFATLSFIIVFLIFWNDSNPVHYISYTRPDFWGVIFIVSVFLAFAIYPRLSACKLLGNYFTTIGKDSIIVYLLHGPIVSISRIILLKLNVYSTLLHIIVGVALGWFGSVLAICIFKRIPYIDFVFYPMKYIKLNKNKQM